MLSGGVFVGGGVGGNNLLNAAWVVPVIGAVGHKSLVNASWGCLVIGGKSLINAACGVFAA